MKPSVYILYSTSLDQYYIGQSMDIERRVKEHNQSAYKSAFTSKASDWELYFLLECESKQQAIRIETHIKKMRKRKYLNYLKSHPSIGLPLQQKFKD